MRFAELKRRIIISEEQGSNSSFTPFVRQNSVLRVESRPESDGLVQRITAGNGA